MSRKWKPQIKRAKSVGIPATPVRGKQGLPQLEEKILWYMIYISDLHKYVSTPRMDVLWQVCPLHATYLLRCTPRDRLTTAPSEMISTTSLQGLPWTIQKHRPRGLWDHWAKRPPAIRTWTSREPRKVGTRQASPSAVGTGARLGGATTPWSLRKQTGMPLSA